MVYVVIPYSVVVCNAYKLIYYRIIYKIRAYDMSEKITAYYQPDRDGDLKGLIQQLRALAGSRFQGRSESEIVRMLLQEKLAEILPSAIQ